MKAIITKYLGPTNTKGERIKAWCAAGSVTIPYPHELDIEKANVKAAQELIQKLKWDNKTYPKPWYIGSLPDRTGYVFVYGAKTFAHYC